MTAIDTNILIYAHREDSPFHKQADRGFSRFPALKTHNPLLA